MQFDGVHEFTQPPTDVWNRLTDARFLAACLPDLETIKEAEADRAVCILRPGFSFARGTLDMEMLVIDKVPGVSAKLVMKSKGIGSQSTVEAGFTLEPIEVGGCRMKWQAVITELSGLLKALPRGLIQGGAKKVLEQAWTNVQTKMASGGRQPPVAEGAEVAEDQQGADAPRSPKNAS